VDHNSLLAYAAVSQRIVLASRISMSSIGFLIGFILNGKHPMRSSPGNLVTVTVIGLRAQSQVAQRGIAATSMGELGVGNATTEGTMPQGETSLIGGFVVPFTFDGDQLFGRYGGQTSVRFRVWRDSIRRGANYEVMAMAIPRLTDYEDFLNAITGHWEHFCAPAREGMAEAGLDAAAKPSILNVVSGMWSTIQRAWSLASIIGNPDARHNLLSVVRIRYPAS
jgi:hypothetical protein